MRYRLPTNHRGFVLLGLFDCLGNRVAVYKDWRAARIGEAKRKHRLWALWDSLPPEKKHGLNIFVYEIKPLEIVVK